ncbi:MAG TPA: hypothetical protein VJQ58_10150 [Burkholderiales bacterium]|nr:hypothetical protein [Burkholderiales bacterium]
MRAGVEFGIAQVHGEDLASKAADVDVIAHVKRPVKKDQHAGEEVGDAVLQREAERKAGETQPGDDAGDVHAERAERGDEAQNPKRDARDACEKLAQRTVRTGALHDAQHAEVRGARKQREEEEQAEGHEDRGHPGDSLGPGLAAELVHRKATAWRGRRSAAGLRGRRSAA